MSEPPSESLVDVQQALAGSSAPAAEFGQLSRSRQREVFFQLPETVQASLVADMDCPPCVGSFAGSTPTRSPTCSGWSTRGPANPCSRGSTRTGASERTEFLLGFSPASTAGLMHLDYVTVSADQSLAEVARRVQRHEERTGRFPHVFVTDGDDLLGELPGQVLAMTEDGIDLREHVHETPAIRYDTPDEDVVDVFRATPESSVAVLDEDGSIMGVIYAEDLLRVVEEEAGETLYEFTGVQEAESVLDGPLSKVRYRYKWLIINLGTAFLAAGAVGFFEDTIAAFTLLAVYMPVVAGMGGNAGTQSMAVTVRGLALGQISLPTGGRAVLNEVLAGVANGAITADGDPM